MSYSGGKGIVFADIFYPKIPIARSVSWKSRIEVEIN